MAGARRSGSSCPRSTPSPRRRSSPPTTRRRPARRSFRTPPIDFEEMARTDHNPRNRRLYLPIVSTSAEVAPADTPASIADTHVAHAIGCAQTARPAGRKPPWLKVKAKTGPNYRDLKGIMRGLDLHTVCEEASCPNIFECWEEREATFLILGERCTRRCGFCDVMTAKPNAVDEGEPERIAEAV